MCARVCSVRFGGAEGDGKRGGDGEINNVRMIQGRDAILRDLWTSQVVSRNSFQLPYLTPLLYICIYSISKTFNDVCPQVIHNYHMTQSFLHDIYIALRTSIRARKNHPSSHPPKKNSAPTSRKKLAW